MGSVLEELLLVLSGNVSDLFLVDSPSNNDSQSLPWNWTLKTQSEIVLDHPGERDLLNALGIIAAKYKRVNLFISSIQIQIKKQTLQSIRQRSKPNGWQNILLARLVSRMRELLKGYQDTICQIQYDIKHGQWELTSNSSTFISIADIRVRLEEWVSPLRAFNQLVSDLLRGPNGTLTKEFTLENRSSHPPQPPSCPYWGSGQLLDLLSRKSETSVGLEHTFMTELLHSIEIQWAHGLIAWMCYGQVKVDNNSDIVSMEEPIVEWVNGKDFVDMSTLSAALPGDAQLSHLISSNDDPLEESVAQRKGYHLKPDSIPNWIKNDQKTFNAILYVGKSLARIREHAKMSTRSNMKKLYKSNGLPASLTNSHIQLLRSSDARPCSKPMEFRKTIERVQNDLSEWMWQNILTNKTVITTFEALGGYFLHRNGLFISSFLERLSQLRKTKVISARSAAAASIRAPDIELALQRACMDNEAEDDLGQLALFEIMMLKPLKESNYQSENWKEYESSSSASSMIGFDDIAIGIPFKLQYHARFPLDTILSSFELKAYSDLFSYLLALRAIKTRLRDCWMCLSKSQRARRKFTGTGEGGQDRMEERRRKDLLRMTCGLAREGIWFLDVLDGHFQTDIIDLQFTKFLEQFRNSETNDKKNEKRESGPTVSVDKWRQKIGQQIHRVSSMGTLREEGSTSDPSPIPSRPQRKSYAAKSMYGGSQFTHHSVLSKKRSMKDKPQNEMNFATSKQSHQAFLAYVLEGLLLTNIEANKCIWRILHTCRHFVGLIDRWGGDVLPELLSEGSITDETKSGKRNEEGSLAYRIKVIKEIVINLRKHLDQFFIILSDASNLSSKKNNGKRSMYPNIDEVVGLTSIYEAQNAALRHHEQLLLRLDFNKFISQRFVHSGIDEEGSRNEKENENDEKER